MGRKLKTSADYFQHPVNLSRDPRVEYMISLFGMEGFGCYISMLEKITDSPGIKLPWGKNASKLLAASLKVSKKMFDSFIDACVEEGIELFLISDGFLMSSQLNEILQPLMEKREKDRERKQGYFPPENDGKSRKTVESLGKPYSRVEESRVEESRVEDKKQKNKPPPDENEAHLIQPDLQLTEKLFAYAQEKDIVDIGGEFQKFKNYHLKKQTKRKDWVRSWQTWCRNSCVPQDFKVFINAYPKKTAETSAKWTWGDLKKTGKLPELSVLLRAIKNINGADPKFLKDPDKWLREERWKDNFQPLPETNIKTITMEDFK